MPSKSTDAIIIHSIDFRESDKIICALTRDQGMINAIARGAKRSKKRFPGTLEPFCEVVLDLFSRKGMELQSIESAKLKTANLGIRENLALFAHASVLLEIVRENLGPQDPSPETFVCLREALSTMEKSRHWFPVWSIGLLSILRSLGYGIDLHDRAANSHTGAALGPFSRLSPEAYACLEKGVSLNHEVLAKLSVRSGAQREISRCLLQVCTAISEKPLKSGTFLAKLLDLDMKQ
ncbi:MAG TPA: DNA repair protein RecO [Deltaproteobacteria bacterium]|nr:DNA repair protein RecO [Deltaproteobacteria bacterium]